MDLSNLIVALLCYFPCRAQGYILSGDCQPFADDIANGIEDVLQSAAVAQYSLDLALGGRVTVADWFGHS